MSVRRLVGRGEINESWETFQSVFQSHDPFGEPFRASVASRVLLFPSSYFPSGYELYATQYRAIVATAAANENTSMYVSEVEGINDQNKFDSARFHGVVQDFKLPPETVALQLQGLGYIASIETAMYSSDGDWGMLTSQENHALIGGTERFISLLSQHLDLESDVPGFLAYWKDVHQRLAVDIAWIPRLLHHIYGHEKATWYITEANFLIDGE